MFWNMRAPSLNPIKGAVSKLEVSSASINTGFCSAERPGYSNATVQHEINKIKEQTLLRLKIKGDLGCQGQLQRSPGYCQLSSRTETRKAAGEGTGSGGRARAGTKENTLPRGAAPTYS